MNIQRKIITALVALMPVIVGAAEEKVLHIYNWADYFAEDTLANFEKETGIKVIYDIYDANEVLEAKMLARGSGYDVVFPAAPFLERQIEAGIYQPIDKKKLPNYKHLDQALVEQLAKHENAAVYGVPYMWGTTGIGYDVDKVRERLGEDAPVNSWDILFKPEYASKLADCGIALVDAPSEIPKIILNYAGLDPNANDPANLKVIEEHLDRLRPYIRYVDLNPLMNDMANGDVCVGVTWNGQVSMSQIRADEANTGVKLAYSIPKEGTMMFFDVMAIPADAPHPEYAHQFINYMLRPDVIAAVSNYVYYANPNKDSTPLVDEAVTGDPNIYPPPAVMDKLFPQLREPPAYTRSVNRVWTKFKTGR